MNATRTDAPLQGDAYSKGTALAFFTAAGMPETIPRGGAIFVEYQKATGLALNHDKMYLLLEGQVEIIAAHKTIGSVGPGEIFGEMAPLSRSARSATALARTPCRVIGLDADQFRGGIEKQPEFALMLMRVMIMRLRDTLARLRADNLLAPDASGKRTAVFDAAMLAELDRELPDAPRPLFRRGDTILREGAAGVLMYAVREGRVLVTIGNTPVEHIGPGGVLGEAALFGQSRRLASASAESDCALLAIDRSAFLRLLRAKPEFGVSVLRALAGRLKFLISRKR